VNFVSKVKDVGKERVGDAPAGQLVTPSHPVGRSNR